MISLRQQCIAAACALASISICHAEEGSVTWYDPTCRFFVAQLPEGFGLYELKAGPEPTVGDVIDGGIMGGPDVKATHKTSGQELALLHWGDAAKQESLIRASPDWCKGKRKKK